jgi:hypothetical protein
MSMSKWEQAIASTNEKRSTTIDLNIHGPPECAEFVATQLYHADMYLQDPLWHAPEIPYVNPQHIEFPGITTHDVLVPSEPSVREESSQGSTIQVFGTEDAVAEFSQLLDVFGQHEHLALEVADAHIATRLLEYQSQTSKFTCHHTNILPQSPKGSVELHHAEGRELYIESAEFLGE